MVRRHRADKRPWWKICLQVVAGILGFIVTFYCFSGIVNACVNVSRNKFAESFAKVEYDETRLIPEKIDGYWTFTTDRELKVVQLTDVHIGGGYFSAGKDKKAMTAVATMLAAEKPDLVVVTGDLIYPVPFQAGTFNNKAGSKTFAKLMEDLGVYWTIAFGNHDTEAYSYFGRDKIYDFYSSGDYPHCIITDIDSYEKDGKTVNGVAGYGNQVIKIKNSGGIVKHALIVLDSHSYTEDDPMGIKWGYDNIKQNQVDWYEYEVKKIDAANKAVNPEIGMFESTAYFHIPLFEVRDAYHALKEKGVNLYENKGQTENLPENITYFEGTFGEDPKKKMVYCSELGDELFEKMLELGSTKAIFTGHDHLNNCIITFKGINFVYGMSIDYLAYAKIATHGRQRGCTVIEIKADGVLGKIDLKNYYENYAAPEKEKSKITMDKYHK